MGWFQRLKYSVINTDIYEELIVTKFSMNLREQRATINGKHVFYTLVTQRVKIK